MGRNTYVVKKAGASGWDVVRDGDRSASAHTSTKTEAIKTAKALTRSAGGGEVLVLGRAGKISNSDTVARPARAQAKSAAKSAGTAATAPGRHAMRALRARLAR